MSFAIVDLELDEPLPAIVLAPGETGAAVLLRRAGRPVHFSLQERPQGGRLAPDQLLELVGEDMSLELVERSVRTQLLRTPATAPLSLTVAVCTHARTGLLELCLRSVLAHSPPGLEVVVVDNAPPDGATEALVRSLPSVRYVLEPRPGLDFARNRALAEANGEFIAYLDDDVVIDRGWLPGLEEAIAENPDTGAVTGLVLPLALESEAQIAFERRGGFRRGLRKRRWAGDHEPGNPLYPTGAGIFGAGCNMVLRREALEALGGFDEALDTGAPLPGGGDLDIFHRVIRAGHPLVYEPAMLAWHRHRHEQEALRRQYWSWGEGFMAYVAKTWATDPEERPKLVRLVRWWLRYELRSLASSLAGSDSLAPTHALAELLGGVAGLMGGYGRSRRRVERIRRAHA